jgi:hypothetical protein
MAVNVAPIYPHIFASGSHHAPIPQMIRLGARSSRVKHVASQKSDITRPIVANPGAHFDLFSYCRIGCHRHNRIPHQTRFRLARQHQNRAFSIRNNPNPSLRSWHPANRRATDSVMVNSLFLAIFRVNFWLHLHLGFLHYFLH